MQCTDKVEATLKSRLKRRNIIKLFKNNIENLAAMELLRKTGIKYWTIKKSVLKWLKMIFRLYLYINSIVKYMYVDVCVLYENLF